MRCLTAIDLEDDQLYGFRFSSDELDVGGINKANYTGHRKNDKSSYR